MFRGSLSKNSMEDKKTVKERLAELEEEFKILDNEFHERIQDNT